MLGVLLAGLLAGIVSGMGIGGGAILIPVILWVTDVTQQQAQGVNLLYFLPTAAVALVTHVKNGSVETPVAKSLIWTGLLGAAAGALLALWLEGELLRKLFGGFSLPLVWQSSIKAEKGRQQTERRRIMDYKDFEKLKERFSRANTDEKVSLYVNTPGLTKDQYRELLEMYPKKDWNLLDQALW